MARRKDQSTLEDPHRGGTFQKKKSNRQDFFLKFTRSAPPTPCATVSFLKIKENDKKK
jgi:hypothetical protein